MARLRDLGCFRLAADREREGPDRAPGRRALRKMHRSADATGRRRRCASARQARCVVRCPRVPGARPVREPLLAHARRSAAPAAYRHDRIAQSRRFSRSSHVVRSQRSFHGLARCRGRHRAGGYQRQAAAGQPGYVTQALGGSFTVYVEGNQFRIAGKDADAIGRSARTAA